MMSTIDAGTAKLAGLQIDMLQKIRNRQITIVHLEWFNNLSVTQRDMLSGADLTKLELRTIHIDRSKPFDPTELIGPDWKIWRGPKDGNGLEGEEEQDKCSLALTEVDLNKIIPDATLKKGETSITGEERLRRLAAKNAIKMDAGIFLTLWNNKHLIPERFKEKTNSNTTYIFVDGTILRCPDGDRCSLCFYWYADNREWCWNYYWLDLDRNAFDPSALLAN